MPAFDANGEEKAVLDLVKLAGNAVETGTGNAGDGTQRVVLADDQPAVPVTGSFWQATQPVSAASLPLPTGAATSAKQDTGNTSLASLDSKVTAVNTNAVTIGSALPAGTNNIGDVDVLSLPALPAGSNAIGKLASNDGVDIGDVTVNNAANAGVYVRPGTGVNLDTSNVTLGAALPAGNNNIGDVDIASVPTPTAIRHEQVSVGTSAVQLTSNAVLTGVNLKADDDNTNSVYIGGAGVTTSTGYRLKAGQSVFIALDNANRLYAIGGAASQKLHVLGS